MERCYCYCCGIEISNTEVMEYGGLCVRCHDEDNEIAMGFLNGNED